LATAISSDAVGEVTILNMIKEQKNRFEAYVKIFCENVFHN